MTKLDNSDRMGPRDGTPDGNPHTLRRRPLDREHSLSGVMTRLVGLRYVADREKQIADPKRMPPLDTVPDIKKWLMDGALTGFIRSDDGIEMEVFPSEWDDAKINSCIAGRVVQVRAEPSNRIVEVPGTGEPALSYGRIARLAQAPERNSARREKILLATAHGLPILEKTVSGKPFFRDRDVERVFGYGWTLFTAVPSLEASADASQADAPQADILAKRAENASEGKPRGRTTIISDTYKAALREFYYGHSHKREIGTAVELGKALDDHLFSIGKSEIIPGDDKQRECRNAVWTEIMNAQDNLALENRSSKRS